MMSKEKYFKAQLTKMFHDRSKKINIHYIDTFWDELKNEKKATLEKLFEKMHNKVWYADMNQQVIRMPIIQEVKKLIMEIKTHHIPTIPSELALPMSENEREKKKIFHMQMSKNIKEIIKNGYCESKIDALFTNN